MNTRWKRVAQLNNWENTMGIVTDKSNEILMYNNELDDYKTVAWADDFKISHKGFSSEGFRRMKGKHKAKKRK